MENENLTPILKYKLVAIARGVAVKDIARTAEALYAGGVRLLEITFDQSSASAVADTTASIRQVKELMGNKMHIGAGTVMTIEQADAAAGAGADFALAPNTNAAVIRRMKACGMAAVPGALTPTEMAVAYEAGADIVKLFPAGRLGIDYARAIQGPLNHIPLMAVGGVDVNNIKRFLDNGFVSAGVGAHIVKNSFIAAGAFDQITKLAEEFVGAI